MSETFSKVILPLTAGQLERAVRLYMPDFDNMTPQMQSLIRVSCQNWQESIRKAANNEK